MRYNLRKIKVLLLAVTVFSFTHTQAQVKILFDNTHGETSGTTADWTIDADLHDMNWGTSSPYVCGSCTHSDPQRYPTPAQSGITSTTAETYWEGALSSWGIDLVRKGYTLESLPFTAALTYGNTANAQDLSHYKVFVVPEPNTVFTTAEKAALIQFIQHGGGLFMISDHVGSDRNFDGWDSPNIWLDFTSSYSNPFGITPDTVEISPNVNTVPNLPTDSLLHGPMGNVTGIKYHQGTSFTISPTANPTVKGVLYASGTSGNTGVLVAHARYGKGKVAALGDSSPMDDGTGNPNSTLYGSYASDAGGSHRILLVNTVIWLAAADVATGIDEPSEAAHISFYQSAPGELRIAYPYDYTADRDIYVYNIAGQQLMKLNGDEQNLRSLDVQSLASGVYFVRTGDSTGKFIR